MVGAWGPRDGDASSEEEEEEEDESPSPTRSREVVLPSAADVVASALEEQAANAQRQAERDAAYGVSYSFFLVGPPPLDVRLNPCATGPSGILRGSI